MHQPYSLKCSDSFYYLNHFFYNFLKFGDLQCFFILSFKYSFLITYVSGYVFNPFSCLNNYMYLLC